MTSNLPSGDSLFDGAPRESSDPATHEENTYQFLNRVAGPFWDRVRTLAETWYQRIPSDQRGDLRSRFRSRESISTLAAFWEIYLHEALVRHGFDVTVHPELPNSERSPDFLAESGESSFYVEATCYFEKDRTSAEERRRERLYDAINQLWNPNFHVWIDIESEGASSPPGAPLRKALDRWLTSLDPEDCQPFPSACDGSALGDLLCDPLPPVPDECDLDPDCNLLPSPSDLLAVPDCDLFPDFPRPTSPGSGWMYASGHVLCDKPVVGLDFGICLEYEAVPGGPDEVQPAFQPGCYFNPGGPIPEQTKDGYADAPCLAFPDQPIARMRTWVWYRHAFSNGRVSDHTAWVTPCVIGQPLI